MKYTLHRVLAEIKHLQSSLEDSKLNQMEVLVIAPPSSGDLDAYRKQFQGAVDQVESRLRNLAKLRAARNLANSTVKVVLPSFGEYTIDEVLAFSQNIKYEELLLARLKGMYVSGKKQLEKELAAWQANLDKQKSALFAGRAASQEEHELIEKAALPHKPEIVSIYNLAQKIEALEKRVQQFKLEMDFALSEVNATTLVEVDL